MWSASKAGTDVSCQTDDETNPDVKRRDLLKGKKTVRFAVDLDTAPERSEDSKPEGDPKPDA